MTNKVQLEADLAANHAADDAFAAVAIARARNLVPPPGMVVGGNMMAPDTIQGGFAEDDAGVRHYFLIKTDVTGISTVETFTDATLTTPSTPTGALNFIEEDLQKLVHLGRVDIPVDTTGPVSLSGIPAGTVGAVIQFDRQTGNRELRSTIDGTPPTATMGTQTVNRATALVGITPVSSGDLSLIHI